MKGENVYEYKREWNQESQNRINPELVTDKIYQDIMYGIQKGLKEFQAVYIAAFHMSVYTDKKYTAEDLKKILQNIKEMLTKDGYIFDLIEEKDEEHGAFIKLTVYLLEKTEEQYKIIEEKFKEISNKKILEEVDSSNRIISAGICTIYLLISMFIFLIIDMIFKSSPLHIPIMITVIIIFIFASCGSYIKGNDIRRAKGYKAKELENFLKNQDRVFCTERVNKEETLRKYSAYEYNSSWQEYLQYAKPRKKLLNTVNN